MVFPSVENHPPLFCCPLHSAALHHVPLYLNKETYINIIQILTKCSQGVYNNNIFSVFTYLQIYTAGSASASKTREREGTWFYVQHTSLTRLAFPEENASLFPAAEALL